MLSPKKTTRRKWKRQKHKDNCNNYDREETI